METMRGKLKPINELIKKKKTNNKNNNKQIKSYHKRATAQPIKQRVLWITKCRLQRNSKTKKNGIFLAQVSDTYAFFLYDAT